MSRKDALYTTFASLFCVVLVLTNIVGVKLFVIFPDGRPAWMPGEGPLTLTAGLLTYPVTFLLTDLVSEIWGRRRADFMVYLGFCMSIVMLVITNVARYLDPSPFWIHERLGFQAPQMQDAFDATFSLQWILLGASMLAYLVAQLFDVRLYHFWWRVTEGRHMWLRNNGSTSISQLVDTILVNGIYLRWGLAMEWGAIGGIIAAVYLVKLAMALLDTPFIYLGRGAVRNWLGLEKEAAPLRAPLELE